MQTKHNKTTGDYFSEWALNGRGDSMAMGHQLLVDAILEKIDVQGKSILDVGCGVGEALASASRAGASQIAGIDLASDMIELARSRQPQGDFKQGSVEVLPWPDAQFDLCISVEAMYYFEQPLDGLKEIYRVLRPGGQFASAIEFFEENAGSTVWADELPMNIWCWSETKWKQTFEAAGFKQVACSRIIRKTFKSESEFVPSNFFPDYARYLDYVQQGALLVVGEKG
ncbi:MAG: class I SAM-dependent methyltransferase [Saprospiraceae bacterium]